MTSQAQPMIRVDQLCKSFKTLDTTVGAAEDLSLEVEAGSVTGLTGPSGSGKSTLLHLIGALDTPDSGTITVDGQEVTALRPDARARYRQEVGFVFQRFNLIPALSVLDNVLVPLLPQGVSREDVARAEELLNAVGLADRPSTLATRLSGGQQQRVAIARALIGQPKLVLADEPTGNLDSHTGAEVVKLLFSLRDELGVTMLIATHEERLASQCDRVVHLADGRITHGGEAL